MKKIACAMYYVMLLLYVIGVLTGGVSNTDGAAVGVVIVYLTMVGSGIFFYMLDHTDRMAPVQSFKLQEKLNSAAMVFFALYFVFFLVSWQGKLADPEQGRVLTGNLQADAFIMSLPYFIMLVPFVFVFSQSFPYNSAKKQFGITAENVDHIVAHGGSFSLLEGAEDTMKNTDHLFFMENKCFIPLDQIVKVERKDIRLFGVLLESTVLITTKTDAKIAVETKDHDALVQSLPDYDFLFEM